MKHIYRSILIFVSIVLFTQQAVSAQSVDNNRMNRDIKIMENILKELFKTNWTAPGNVATVRTGFLTLDSHRDVRGTYLPGYGIIFTIPGGPPGLTMLTDNEGDFSGFTFEYGDGGNDDKITEENIINRISEFLRDYGPTIGQLSDNENVMVIYDTQKSHNHNFIFTVGDNGSRNARKSQLPTISVVATQKNLKSYRAGNLNQAQFDSRLQISKTDPDAKQQLDLKVMANIFETAFKESEEPAFRIRGKVNFLNLDNFGAIFTFNARYGTSAFSFAHFDGALNIASVDVHKNDDGHPRITVRKKVEDDEAAEEKMKQQKEDILQAYNSFVADLKEYLIDYGRTLKSVKPEQHILVSVSISGQSEGIPERLDIQVQKSVLEQLESSSLTRDRALDEVSVREF